MTAPAYRVACIRCGTEVYNDNEPPGNPGGLLAGFANSDCPIGGTANGCPSTTQANVNRDDENPAKLRGALKALRDARVRGTTVALPALTAGTPVEVTVMWAAPLPDSVYRVAVTPVHGAGLLGALRWCLKPGSLSATECVLIVASTTNVTPGQAGMHVVAAP